MKVNTIFDFNVSYDDKAYTVEDIKEMLLKFASTTQFDIGISEVETYPEGE